MNFKTKALSVFSAAILGIGVSSGVALAQEEAEADIDITIEPGEFVVELDITMGDTTVEPGLEGGTVTGEATITVTDARGVLEGWAVSASADDFIDGTWTGDSISLSEGDVTAEGSEAEYVAAPGGTLGSGDETVLNATETTIGATYTAGYPVEVDVPGGLEADTYTSTIIVTASTDVEPEDPENGNGGE